MEAKGDAYMSEAEKALHKFSFFGIGGSEKAEKAHDKFLQAGTHYKASGNYAKAAAAYERAADMSAKCGNEGEQVMELQEAARALGKTARPSEATALYTRIVDTHDRNRKFAEAGKACVALATLLTTPSEALPWYERALSYYRRENMKASVSSTAEKIADLRVAAGDYAGARDAYEDLARDTLDDRALRTAARKLFFTALLAQLAQLTPTSLLEDADVLQERFREYESLDSQFNVHTREHMLITALIDALHDENVDAYEAAVGEYDSICPLDPLREEMLQRGAQALRARTSDLR